MAIKKKQAKAETALPEALRGLLQKGFTASVLEKQFKAEAGSARSDIKEYLEAEKDGFVAADHLQGSSLYTEFGKLTISDNSRYDIDKDKLQELVESGKITLTSLLGACRFNNTDLKKVVGETAFAEIAEKTEGEKLAFGASPEFKESILGAFEASGWTPAKEEEPAPKKPAKKKAEKKSSVEKIRAAKKKAQKSKDAKGDLEDILNG